MHKKLAELVSNLAWTPLLSFVPKLLAECQKRPRFANMRNEKQQQQPISVYFCFHHLAINGDRHSLLFGSVRYKEKWAGRHQKTSTRSQKKERKKKRKMQTSTVLGVWVCVWGGVEGTKKVILSRLMRVILAQGPC